MNTEVLSNSQWEEQKYS